MPNSIRTLDMVKSLIREIPESAALSTLADGIFIEINEYLPDLLGYSREQIVGRTSSEISIWTDPKDRVRFK